MSTIPPLALERLAKLRRMRALAQASHRHLQQDRNGLQDRLQSAVHGLEIVARGRPLERYAAARQQPPAPATPGNRLRAPESDTPPVIAQALRDVERAKALLAEHNDLLQEASARGTGVGDMLAACERLLRERFGWREER